MSILVLLCCSRVHLPFGNPAPSLRRPVALRTRLATGLPFSRRPRPRFPLAKILIAAHEGVKPSRSFFLAPPNLAPTG